MEIPSVPCFIRFDQGDLEAAQGGHLLIGHGQLKRQGTQVGAGRES